MKPHQFISAALNDQAEYLYVIAYSIQQWTQAKMDTSKRTRAKVYLPSVRYIYMRTAMSVVIIDVQHVTNVQHRSYFGLSKCI